MRAAARRTPGVILVAGLAVFIVGAAIGFLAPSLREAPPYVTDDIAAAAQAIAGNPTAWQWSAGLILAAAVITTLGLVPLALALDEAARPWAVAGLVAFAMAAVIEVISGLIAIGITTWGAQRYPDPDAQLIFESFDRIHFGSAFFILASLAVGMFGAALVRAGATASGWAFVGTGLFLVVLEVTGFAIPLYLYLTTAALGMNWRQIGSQIRSESDGVSIGTS